MPSDQRPMADLRPYHLARAGVVICVLLAVSGEPGVGWLIAAGGCLAAEWYTRTRRLGWPDGIRDVLAAAGLAPPRDGAEAHRVTARLRSIAVALTTSPAGPERPLAGPRPMTPADIFRVAAVATRRHWRVSVVFTVVALIVAVAVISTAFGALAELAPASMDADGSGVSAVLGVVVSVAVVLYFAVVAGVGIPVDAAINGVTVVTADAAVRGVPIRLSAAVAAVRPRFPALCRLMAAYYALWIALSAPLPILALWLGGVTALFTVAALTFPVSFAIGIALSLSPVVLTLEGGGAGAALSRSVRLVRAAFGRVVALHLVWVAMVLGVFALAGPAVVAGALVPPLQLVIFPALAAVVAFALPYFRTLQTLIYLDLRIREGGCRPDPPSAGAPAGPAPERPRVSLRKEPAAAVPADRPSPEPSIPFPPVPSPAAVPAPDAVPNPDRAPAASPAPSPLAVGAPARPRPARALCGRGGAAALVVVLVMAIAGGAVWSLREAGRSPAAPLANGLLRHTFPAEPSPAWTLPATDLFAGAEFWSPAPSPTGGTTPGFLDLGDALIVRAILPGSDRGESIAAIDPRSGAVRWITGDTGYETCASRTVDGLLPCYRDGGLGPGEEFSEVAFLRMSDGSVARALPTGDIAWLEVDGADVVTASYTRVSSGSVEDLTANWSVAWEPDPVCPGSGDTFQYGLTADFVHFGSDAGAIVLRRADGARVLAEDVQQVAVHPGRGLTARTCVAGRDAVVVLDSAGDRVRTHSGGTGAATPVAGAGDEPYVVAGAAWDFAGGERLWSADDLGDRAVVLGGTVVASGGGRLTGLDLATGARKWAVPIALRSWMSDGNRLLAADFDDRLHGIDLASGAVAWTMPVRGALQVAGDGFAEIDADALTYYPPTGGPAGAGPSPEPGDPAARDALLTRCGRAPELTPVEYRTGADALIVRMEMRANCPGGDILATDGLHITITDRGQPVAAGTFDLSARPILLPAVPSGADAVVEHEFEFPLGSFWRLPNSLAEYPDPGALRARGAATHLVECVDRGTDHGPATASAEPVTAVRSYPVTRPAPPVDADATALDALRAQADADRPFVRRDLADRWVPQLSAKRPWLVAPDVDGRVVTWTPAEILAQHLRLRLRYPEVRLVLSDEWSTFDLRGWWITIAGVTYGGPEGANAWCDAKGIAPDECFAKLVSDTRGPRGTTGYR